MIREAQGRKMALEEVRTLPKRPELKQEKELVSPEGQGFGLFLMEWVTKVLGGKDKLSKKDRSIWKACF